MPQYYQTNTSTYASVQAGNVVAGVWTEGVADFFATELLPVGLTFTLHSTFDSQRGVPLDPPVWNTLTFTLTRSLLFGTAPLKLYAVPTAAPSLWSTSNPPTTTGATLLATHTGTALGSISFSCGMTVLRPVLAHSTWRGRLSLVLTLDGAGFSTFTAGTAIVTATTAPFTTGINTPDIDRAGRIRTCPRTGRLAFADEFVRDGYVEGAWVHADSYDPEDLADEYTLPSSEGQIHDEIP